MDIQRTSNGFNFTSNGIRTQDALIDKAQALGLIDHKEANSLRSIVRDNIKALPK